MYQIYNERMLKQMLLCCTTYFEFVLAVPQHVQLKFAIMCVQLKLYLTKLGYFTIGTRNRLRNCLYGDTVCKSGVFSVPTHKKNEEVGFLQFGVVFLKFLAHMTLNCTCPFCACTCTFCACVCARACTNGGIVKH